MNPGDDKEIKFKNNKDNIIDKSRYIEPKAEEKAQNKNSVNEFRKNDGNWNKIYTDVKNYNENENLIVNKLKTPGDQIYIGY